MHGRWAGGGRRRECSRRFWKGLIIPGLVREPGQTEGKRVRSEGQRLYRSDFRHPCRRLGVDQGAASERCRRQNQDHSFGCSPRAPSGPDLLLGPGDFFFYPTFPGNPLPIPVVKVSPRGVVINSTTRIGKTELSQTEPILTSWGLSSAPLPGATCRISSSRHP